MIDFINYSKKAIVALLVAGITHFFTTYNVQTTPAVVETFVGTLVTAIGTAVAVYIAKNSTKKPF